MSNLTPPTHGPTGSPVVDYDMTTRNDVVEHRYLPPPKPTRVIDIYDDDGNAVDERTLSDEEFAESAAAYERNLAEYKRTGGLYFESRGTTTRINVTCADGTKAEGGWGGTEWRWFSWETSNRRP